MPVNRRVYEREVLIRRKCTWRTHQKKNNANLRQHKKTIGGMWGMEAGHSSARKRARTRMRTRARARAKAKARARVRARARGGRNWRARHRIYIILFMCNVLHILIYTKRIYNSAGDWSAREREREPPPPRPPPGERLRKYFV